MIAVILLYGLIVERALRAALICRDGFGKLVATGLAGVFALQVFVVIGGVTRLIPLTGLTTPFLSYGGSSLVANWVIVALLLRISDQARRPVPDLSAEADDADDESTQVIKVGDRRDEQADPHHLDLLPAAVPGADAQRHLPAVLRSRATYDDDPRNRRVIEAAYSRERGAILVGRDAGRRERAVRRPVRVPAHLPRAVQVRPRSPATSPTSARPASSRPRTTCSPATTTGCSSTKLVDLLSNKPARAATSS